MQLPILAYGHTILTTKCQEISHTYPELDKLIDDLWETMYAAGGCGLAAPQVNHPIRLFVVDSQKTYGLMPPEDRKKYFVYDQGIKETFLNARILASSKETWQDTEGCLSIPALREEVTRPWRITIEYLDRQFQTQVRTLSGLTARMVQHEYDHTEGILYLDRLDPSKRTLLQDRLAGIAAGKATPSYPMQFVQ
ncbi:peptide deformylase [Pontibacter sp. HJ8]